VNDLVSLAGKRYRITLDPSVQDDSSKAERRWLCRIPCKYGFISIHGPDTLAAFANTSIMAGKLVAVSGVKVHQRGDREVRVLVAPDMLDAIADLLRARRKRQVSEAERDRLAAIGFKATLRAS
jgi:hypothetical protein